MEERLADSLSSQRANMLLMGIFAALALTLAAIGIFGVIAYLVTRRSREIGIRMALGARPSDVLAMIIRHGMALTTVGIAAAPAERSLLPDPFAAYSTAYPRATQLRWPRLRCFSQPLQPRRATCRRAKQRLSIR